MNASDQWGLTPALYSDGKYFFYEVNNRIKQIEMNVLLKNE